jgi:hypothetical protein
MNVFYLILGVYLNLVPRNLKELSAEGAEGITRRTLRECGSSSSLSTHGLAILCGLV